jgi:transcriptional regulator of acetoin/glycerol metabolism
MRCLAVPIHDSEGRTIAAMSATDHAERMTGDRQYEVRDALTSAARLLECRVFPPDPELGPGRIRRRRDNPVELVMLG